MTVKIVINAFGPIGSGKTLAVNEMLKALADKYVIQELLTQEALNAETTIIQVELK